MSGRGHVSVGAAPAAGARQGVEFRPATRSEVDAFYGQYNASDYSLKAWIGLVDGVPAAIGGFCYRGGVIDAFMDIRSDAARRAKVSIVKAAKAVLADAASNGYRFIYADPDPKEPTAQRFLSRLDFAPINPETSRFVWRLGQ